jgi:lipopolysaccharide assembly protein A
MQALRTIIWVIIAVVLAIFARNNWTDVTVNLWGDLQADIKLPLLLAIAWGVGFVPALILRGRLWRVNRKLAVHQQVAAANAAAPGDPRGDGASEGVV